MENGLFEIFLSKRKMSVPHVYPFPRPVFFRTKTFHSFDLEPLL